MNSKKILIVDDEPNIIELLAFHLQKEGYQVITADNGLKALEAAEKEQPDFIILDVMLPEMDGFEVCKNLRARQNNAPVLMLTAKDDEISKVLGLEIGADDYLVKPFSTRELIARIKTIFRRLKPKTNQAALLSYHNLTIDLNKYQASVNEAVLTLTAKEFELLTVLVRNPGKVFTRDTLLDQLWGYSYYGDTRTVDVHIRRLRQKLEPYKLDTAIETVRGVGYKLQENYHA
ncbi:MAG: response regulator transcription factor [bacterium]